VEKNQGQYRSRIWSSLCVYYYDHPSSNVLASYRLLIDIRKRHIACVSCNSVLSYSFPGHVRKVCAGELNQCSNTGSIIYQEPGQKQMAVIVGSSCLFLLSVSISLSVIQSFSRHSVIQSLSHSVIQSVRVIGVPHGEKLISLWETNTCSYTGKKNQLRKSLPQKFRK